MNWPISPALRLCVQAFAVARLAHLDWRRYVDQEEVASLADHLPDLGSRGGERRDGRADCDAAVPGDLGGDETDTRNVEVAVGS